MKKSLLDLLQSKRFIVLVASYIAVVASKLDIGLDDETAKELAEQLTTLACTFIGGMSLSDAAKAVTMPQGIGHKDSSP